MLNVLRPFLARLLTPVGEALARTPVTPNAITLTGTAGVVAGALWLFPTGHLFIGTLVCTFFVMADMLDGASIRTAIQRLRAQVEDRSIPSSELSGYTISLSNFGMFAGRYATPVVVPPCVAIVGAGKLSHDVVAVIGGIEVHRRLPISLTFDHRACTGGEAARFLKALLDDMSLPN